MPPALRASLAISLGAVPGALCRYYLGLWFTRQFGSSFPYGTLFINVSGCWIMGLFVTLALGRATRIPPEIRLLVATGFLGAYTTFSSYELDTLMLLNHAQAFSQLLYWLGSAVLGIIAVQAGVILARQLEAWRSPDLQD